MPRIESVQTLREWARKDRLETVLLLTDIVGSTRLAGRGDDELIEMLIEHFERAREIHDDFDCYEIKLIGDAYMAVFATASDAFKFAYELIVDTGHEEIFIRAAIHMGRVGIVENDIYGIMVNKTSRIARSIGEQRPARMPPSCIAISDQAKPSVIANVGRNAEGLFEPHDVDLKSFGRERVWFYRDEGLSKEFEAGRPELSSYGDSDRDCSPR